MPSLRQMKIHAAIAAVTAGMLLALPALAADQYLGMEYARGFGLPMTDVRVLATNLIRSFMGFLGLVLVAQIMWGGFLMMTHGGNEDRHHKATATLRDAVIGLIIIMSASSIVGFVVNAIINATGAYL